MLSRVANAVYWMARYVERGENIARFFDVNLHLTLDMPGTATQQWEPLVTTTGDREVFRANYGEASLDTVMEFLVFDPGNPNSVLSCLAQARENARFVREIISTEMWEQVNSMYLHVKSDEARAKALDEPYVFFRRLRMSSHLFVGVTDTTMSHNEAWHFCRLGRKFERADKTSRILDVKYFMLLPKPTYVGMTYDDLHWASLLRSASALEMYRQKHGGIAPADVVDFLLLDRDFPRSICHCLLASLDSMRVITGSPHGQYRNEAERRLGQLCAQLEYSNVEDIIESGLHEFLDSFQQSLNEVGREIYDAFFALPPIGADG